MKKIILITTDGCYACQVMHNMIKEALSNTRAVVNYERVNRKDLDSSYLKRYKINDFPIIQYIIDDVVMFQTEGTYPSAVVNRYIDVHLK